MRHSTKYSPEVRERAVRMVFEHTPEHSSQWAAITSIAGKIGCNPETLRNWVRQAERDVGARPGDLTPVVSAEKSWSRPQRHESLGSHSSGWRHRC
jgi:transposase